MEGESNQTGLHLSVRYKALSAIHILGSHGADINAVDSSGMTPLHMAAGILHKDIIASLIKEGADINMVCVVSCVLGVFFSFFFVVGLCCIFYCINVTTKHQRQIQKTLSQQL